MTNHHTGTIPLHDTPLALQHVEHRILSTTRRFERVAHAPNPSQAPDYVDKAAKAAVEAYNCAQRAHQNTVENMATVQIFGVVEGLMFPKFAGGCLLTYAIGRIIYGYGYRNNGASGRRAGGLISHLGDLPLYLGMGYCAAVALGYV